jgi:very-short-patch-repair endonuclease
MDLYKTAREFPRSLNGGARLLTTTDIMRAGISPTSLRWHVAKGRLVRAHHGTYLAPAREPLDLLDHVRAALSICPEGTLVGFHTAAVLLGFGVAEDQRVHVVVPVGGLRPGHAAIQVHQTRVPLPAPLCPRGIPCTPPARTAIDLARCLDRVTAVAVLDAALHAQTCTRADLEREVGLHKGLPGTRQARELVALADGRPECKQESHLRLILHDGGLTGFEPQVKVFDPHRSSRYERYRLDLASKEHLVAAEYDGESHTRGGLRADRRRHNWLDSMGWRMCYFTDIDLYGPQDRIVAVMISAINRRR